MWSLRLLPCSQYRFNANSARTAIADMPIDQSMEVVQQQGSTNKKSNETRQKNALQASFYLVNSLPSLSKITLPLIMSVRHNRNKRIGEHGNKKWARGRSLIVYNPDTRITSISVRLHRLCRDIWNKHKKNLNSFNCIRSKRISQLITSLTSQIQWLPHKQKDFGSLRSGELPIETQSTWIQSCILRHEILLSYQFQPAF